MLEIRSKVDDNLLHLIVKKGTLDGQLDERVNLGDEKDFIQVALLNIKLRKSFQSHRHILRDVSFDQVNAQEAWFIVSGQVRVTYFDVDDTQIFTEILESGDLSITYRGGHGYEILTEKTQIIEIKTGPYEGPTLDKVFIS
jgi:hypothetical protein